METKYKKVEEEIALVNKTRTRVNSTTGYRGVSKRTSSKFPRPYEAVFLFKKQKVNLGYYATPEEAQLGRIIFIDSLK